MNDIISIPSDGSEPEMTDEKADIHFAGTISTRYGTKATIESEFSAKDDIKALDWEGTHRSWEAHIKMWAVDFEALDSAIESLCDMGNTVTCELSIAKDYEQTFDRVFLHERVPDHETSDYEPMTDDEVSEIMGEDEDDFGTVEIPGDEPEDEYELPPAPVDIRTDGGEAVEEENDDDSEPEIRAKKFGDTDTDDVTIDARDGSGKVMVDVMLPSGRNVVMVVADDDGVVAGAFDEEPDENGIRMIDCETIEFEDGGEEEEDDCGFIAGQTFDDGGVEITIERIDGDEITIHESGGSWENTETMTASKFDRYLNNFDVDRTDDDESSGFSSVFEPWSLPRDPTPAEEARANEQTETALREAAHLLDCSNEPEVGVTDALRPACDYLMEDCDVEDLVWKVARNHTMGAIYNVFDEATVILPREEAVERLIEKIKLYDPNF